MTNEKVEMDKHINDRYVNAMNYYWSASKSNKKWYKLTRSFTVILGALVTLISSLSSSKLIENTLLVLSLYLVLQ